METTITTRAGNKITGVIKPYSDDADTIQVTKGKWKGKHLVIKKADRE
jgi:hypothetical protein